MPDSSLILLLNLIATWYMVGLIWLIQLVHYKQFELIGEANWCDYHRRHTQAVTWVVGPAMLIEAATAVGLLFARPAGVPLWLAWMGFVIVVAIWISTAAVQVPQHHKLASKFDAAACRSLLRGNWFRTIAWTLRGVLMAYAMHGAG